MNRGIGRYVVNLILDLNRYAPEHELTLFVREGFPIPTELDGLKSVTVGGRDWDSKKLQLWQKIPYIRSRPYLRKMHMNRAIRSQGHAMEVALAKNPQDILHNPSALDIGSYPIYTPNCPYVATFLDAIVYKSKDFWERCPSDLQSYYLQQVEHLKKATRIVAISQSAANDAQEVFGIGIKDVIYPSVDPKYGEPVDPILKDRYFLFCSVPDFHKNPKVVIEAFSRLETDAKLIFISPQDEWLAPMMREFAEQCGVADRFEITGFVPEEQMASYFQHAIALVSPSQMEGFGLPVAQAMTAGTPVITSKFSAQGEIAKDVGLLVDPNSVDEVAEAMIEVLAASTSESWRSTGRARGEQFEPEKIASMWSQLYASVVAKK